MGSIRPGELADRPDAYWLAPGRAYTNPRGDRRAFPLNRTDLRGHAAMAQLEQTRLRPNWRNKMLIITIVLILFGGWGLLDAVWVYPARGAKVAEIREYEHLEAISSEWSGARIRAADAGIPEPTQRLAELREIRRERGSLDGRQSTAEAWLIALSRIGRLDPAYTTFTEEAGERNPNERLSELSTRWATITDRPKPLSSYDIPVQWVIMGGAWAFAAYIIVLMLRTASRKWTWDPETLTLKTPEGDAITPADLEDVDKRKWSKYFVSLVIKPEHATLGGKAVEVDLYRRDPIESWVLQMEAKAFPERAETAGEDAASAIAPSVAGEPTPGESVISRGEVS